MCFCKHKKFVAKVTYRFEGKTEAECNKKLKEFYATKDNAKGFSSATYPGSCHKNTFDKAIQEQIVDKFVNLMMNYGWALDEVDALIEELPDRIDQAANQYAEEVAADMAYDAYKDRMAEEAIEKNW
jgi:hypothetical protein